MFAAFMLQLCISTRWKRGQVRHEWIVKGDIHGQLYFLETRSTQGANWCAFAILSCAVFDKTHFLWRLDPGHGTDGRFGGVRVVDRKSCQAHDHTFITAYAPQATATEDEKQAF